MLNVVEKGVMPRGPIGRPAGGPSLRISAETSMALNLL